MQVTEVRKPLASISKICTQGHTVTFHDKGGFITHIESGQKTEFKRKNGVYVLDVWVAKGNDQADFPRPGR